MVKKTELDNKNNNFYNEKMGIDLNFLFIKIATWNISRGII